MLRFQPSYEQMKMALTVALTACRATPRPTAVHKLRTTSRRLDALLQVTRTEHARALRAVQAIDDVQRSLRKICKAAGPVRDCDVQAQLVASIGDRLVSNLRGKKRETISQEAHKLLKGVETKRKKLKKELLKTLSAIELPLQEELAVCEEALARLRPTSTTPLECARRWLKSASPSSHIESSEALHTFRKRTKGARYIAELQVRSPSSADLAQRLHAVHDAIGSWHDSDVLCQKALDVLGRKSTLALAIATKRDRGWQAALRSLAAFQRRFLSPVRPS